MKKLLLLLLIILICVSLIVLLSPEEKRVDNQQLACECERYIYELYTLRKRNGADFVSIELLQQHGRLTKDDQRRLEKLRNKIDACEMLEKQSRQNGQRWECDTEQAPVSIELINPW